ncbi:MAG: glycosyltransferase family A protein [Bacteroidota bacterium]
MRIDEITVVVPTKNEEDNIVPFLSSLDPNVELIVVDASTDQTRERIAAHRPNRTRVIQQASTIPEARNIGLKAAQTEWILFTDADMSFEATYWDNLRNKNLGPHVGAIQGGKLSADGEYRLYYRMFTLGIRVLSWLTIPAGSGSNMIFRREPFLDAGGFDEALVANEDIYALWTMRKTGWRVPFVSGLNVLERDHRRLDQGRFRKTIHGWIRPVMLFSGLGASQVRKSDWGYWDESSREPDSDPPSE